MSAFNQLYNYKANWNNSYSTTKEISSYWNAGGAGPTTVYDYLSTNNVVIQSSTILNYLSVVGNATVLGNLTAYGNTTFINTLVTVTTAASGEFNNLLVGSLTANEFFSPKFDSVYNTVYALSNFWDEENALVAPLQSASANWNSTYTSVSINSSGWESTETNVRTGSANWNSVYTTVRDNSAFWDEENALVAPLQSASGYWNTAYNNLVSNSADWDNTYTKVSTNSSDWDNAYTQFSTNSATYATIGFADGKFLPLSGGAITGNVTSTGTLSTNNDASFASLSTININVDNFSNTVGSSAGVYLSITVAGSAFKIPLYFES